MNAYELAHKLNNAIGVDFGLLTIVANRLRQQADRIAELEKELTTKYGKSGQSIPCAINTTPQTNAEPVAWMYQDAEGRSVSFYRDTLPCGAIPLYTTPQTKPLSDALAIVEEFRGDKELVFKDYEDTYPDGWLDACNEIYWAIEAKVRG